jgi:hypothetical protein
LKKNRYLEQHAYDATWKITLFSHHIKQEIIPRVCKKSTIYPYQYPSNFIFCCGISEHSSQDYISKERYEISLNLIRS